eukprot:739127-Hanusia_phi.AAC.1
MSAISPSKPRPVTPGSQKNDGRGHKLREGSVACGPCHRSRGLRGLRSCDQASSLGVADLVQQ